MTTNLRRIAVAAVGLLLAGLMPVVLAPAAAASENLIEVTPATTSVQVPAPGHSNDWSMQVTNVSDRDLELSFEVYGPGGTALEGAHPMELSLTGSDSKAYADRASLAGLLDKALPIPALAPGESFVMTGNASLPGAAGDEYRTATADVKFRFVAQAGDAPVVEEVEEPVIEIGPVAVTGSEAILAGMLGSGLLAVGLILMAIRKKRSAE